MTAIPRILLGTAMLLSVHTLTALELSLHAWYPDDTPSVECKASDFDSGELIRRMDNGGTIRITWQFRLGGSEATVIHYARHDSLGEGYIIFGDSQNDSTGPYVDMDLIQAFSALSQTDLEPLGFWSEMEMLEGRVLLDFETGNSPLSLSSFFPGKRLRSGWVSIPHPEVEQR